MPHTQTVACIVNTAGVEMVGFLETDTIPKLDETGTKLMGNTALGTLTEFKVLWLHKPLKSQLLMGPRGPQNSLIPLSQVGEHGDEPKVRIMADDIMYIGKPRADIESGYVEGMSGLALPKGAGSLSLVKP